MSDNTLNTVVRLACPQCGGRLELASDEIKCARHHVFKIVRGVPRFVPDDGYADSFGLQWNEFRQSQLDSHTGHPVSRDRLQRLFHGNLGQISGKTVLEAGCGAGRFTEIFLAEGAKVFAADLSSAVDASRANFGERPNYFLCQANILELPIEPEQFDYVVCIGVLQHTPDPEQTIAQLVRHLKPGGMLVIDHYGPDYPATPSRRALRSVLRHLRPRAAMKATNAIVAALWPFHRAAWKYKNTKLVKPFWPYWIWLSPVVDYHGEFWPIGKENLRIWAMLDTHDTLTDYFKHLRSAEQLAAHLGDLGLSDLHTRSLGEGTKAMKVEVTARRPDSKRPAV